jgi:hypothetical protein
MVLRFSFFSVNLTMPVIEQAEDYDGFCCR